MGSAPEGNRAEGLEADGQQEREWQLQLAQHLEPTFRVCALLWIVKYLHVWFRGGLGLKILFSNEGSRSWSLGFGALRGGFLVEKGCISGSGSCNSLSTCALVGGLGLEQLLRRIVKSFRGGLAFKARRYIAQL